MKVTKFPNKISSGKRTMVLGSFNSFHDGHKILLDIAKSYKNKVIFMIIDDLSSLKKSSKKEYHTLDIRLQHMANIGVDEVVVVEFNPSIMAMNGKDFAAKLKEIYNVERFVVGKDFAMGKNAEYEAKDLQVDFPTTIVKTKMINDKKLSTSLLREFVEFGDVKLIKQNSPFWFTIDTRVSNDGFFEIKGLTPHTGIYATWAIVNDVKYWSVVRISKTGKHEIKIPELLLKNTGFDVQIEFANKIRAIIRSDYDVLKEQDLEESVNYLKNTL